MPEPDGEMTVGIVGQFDASRINDDEVGAAPHGLFDAGAHNGMVLRGIRAADEDRAGDLDVIEGVGCQAGAEHTFQSRRARGVAHAGTAIHVVGADNGSHEFLRDIIVLVRRARRAQNPDAVWPVAVDQVA